MRDARSPFSEFIDGFLTAKGLAPKTRKDYGRYLREFDRFTARVSLEDALTLDHAAQWVEQIRPRGAYAALNASTYLKSMASWIAKSRYIVIPGGGSILAGLDRPKTPKTKRRNFTDDQLTAIWACLTDTRDIAYVRLLVGSGLRRNEARQLALANLHLDEAQPWIHVDARTSKGQKERDVRLDPDAVMPILRYIAIRPSFNCDCADSETEGVCAHAEPLFVTEYGTGFTEAGFGSMAGRVGDLIQKRTGIRWHSHLCRHTWATNYHRGMQYTGNTVYDMKSEGGWADLNIVMTYAHARPLQELLEMRTPASALRDERAKKATA